MSKNKKNVQSAEATEPQPSNANGITPQAEGREVQPSPPSKTEKTEMTPKEAGQQILAIIKSQNERLDRMETVVTSLIENQKNLIANMNQKSGQGDSEITGILKKIFEDKGSNPMDAMFMQIGREHYFRSMAYSDMLIEEQAKAMGKEFSKAFTERHKKYLDEYAKIGGGKDEPKPQ